MICMFRVIHYYLQMHSWVPNRHPTPLIIFSVFFSTQDILIPNPIKYWVKFPTQAKFLKQSTYADIFEILIKERSLCIVFSFVSSCTEQNTFCFILRASIKKPTYCQLLPSFHKSNQMLVDVFYWMCFLILFYRMNFICFADHSNPLLLIFCFFSFILSLLFHFVPTSVSA